jgi:hypothetical protein
MKATLSGKKGSPDAIDFLQRLIQNDSQALIAVSDKAGNAVLAGAVDGALRDNFTVAAGDACDDAGADR